MATKDWNGFKKNGDTYIPNDATARTGLQNKVDKVAGKGLSTNDYDNTAKGIVDNIQDNVKANTQLISESIWGENGKNLLQHIQPSKTEEGVSWTYGSNGEVIANGTTGGSVSSFNEPVSLKAGKYIVSGCPANGSVNTYCIRIAIGSATATALAWEYGTGVEITLEEDSVVYIQSQIRQNQTANNVVFKPMVRDADILDDTFEPYHSSVKDSMFPREEQRVLGAKNQIDVSQTIAGHSKAVISNLTSKGFTVSTSEAASNVASKTPLNLISGKTYKVTLDVTAITGSNGRVAVRDSNSIIKAYTDINATGSYTFDFTFDDGYYFAVFATTSTAETGSITVDNVMVSFDGGTYVPYAMTNRELTEFNAIETTLYQATSTHEKVASVNIAKLRKTGKVVEATLDFAVGDSNISSWTDDLIVFNVPYNSDNMVASIRDLSEATGSDIQTVLMKPGSGNKIGFTTSKALLANHRYVVTFVYITYN